MGVGGQICKTLSARPQSEIIHVYTRACKPTRVEVTGLRNLLEVMHSACSICSISVDANVLQFLGRRGMK